MSDDLAARVMASLTARPMKKTHRKPAASDWARVEQALGFQVPLELRAFLGPYNGHAFYDFWAGFELASGQFAKRGGFELLFGFGTPYGLAEGIKTWKGRVPKGFLPFGSDGTGNLVCVDVTGEKLGFYYWDHELEHEGPEGCICKVASGLRSFLGALEPMKRGE